MSEHLERALAEAYSLGALDPPEKKLFEAHLGSCRICRESVGGAAVVVNSLALSAPKEPPPKGSGDRLMALYRQERAADPPPPSRGTGGLGNTLAGVFALIGLGVAGWGYHERDRAEGLKNDIESLKNEKKALESQVDKCQNEKDVLGAPDITFFKDFEKKNGYSGNTPTIAYSPTKGVAVLGESMPSPAEGKVYKLWLVSLAGGKITGVTGMGVFKTGTFIDKSPGKPADTIRFAISEESNPDVEKPTRPILMPA